MIFWQTDPDKFSIGCLNVLPIMNLLNHYPNLNVLRIKDFIDEIEEFHTIKEATTSKPENCLSANSRHQLLSLVPRYPQKPLSHR
nr:hypothetical protein [Tanacetum cinerariifolium]